MLSDLSFRSAFVFSINSLILFGFPLTFLFSWSQPCPQSCFKKWKTSLSPSSYNENMCWTMVELKPHYLLSRGFVFVCMQLCKNITKCFLFTFLVLVLQSVCFICASWKRKQTLEQKSHHACDWTKSKQKQSDVTFKLATCSVVRFSRQTMQWYC